MHYIWLCLSTYPPVPMPESLSQDASQVARRLALDLTGDTFEPLEEQIIQIPTNAINGKEAQIMDVKFTCEVGPANLRRIYLVEPVGLAHLRRDVISPS